MVDKDAETGERSSMEPRPPISSNNDNSNVFNNSNNTSSITTTTTTATATCKSASSTSNFRPKADTVNDLNLLGNWGLLVSNHLMFISFQIIQLTSLIQLKNQYIISRVLRHSTPRYVGWSVGWSVGRSVGRLVGWLVGRSVPFLLFRRFRAF